MSQDYTHCVDWIAEAFKGDSLVPAEVHLIRGLLIVKPSDTGWDDRSIGVYDAQTVAQAHKYAVRALADGEFEDMTEAFFDLGIPDLTREPDPAEA